jgi:hypothetical protein
MSPRERLPDRRESVNFEFEFYGLRYTCSFSRYDDGRVAELFLSNTKSGSQSDANARESAIAASIALQHGTSLETLRGAALRNADGAAATPLGAALDLIAAEKPMHSVVPELPLQWQYAGSRDVTYSIGTRTEHKHEAQAAWITARGPGRYRIWQRGSVYAVMRLKPLAADPQKFSARLLVFKAPTWEAAVAIAERDNARLCGGE